MGHDVTALFTGHWHRYQPSRLGAGGDSWETGGGSTWLTGSYDPEFDLLYWGIGNPAPWPGTEEFPNGTSRQGPNLYTSSVVALNIKSGKLKW